jgi:hypothetical protein
VAAGLATLAGALSAFAVGLSCSGPLSDSCAVLGTCGPAEGLDASAETSADATPEASAEAAKPCDPTGDPKDESCVLDSAYGVFVAAPLDPDAGADAGDAGVPSGDGTAPHPYPTIGQALANPGGKSRIYVCSGRYDEQVNVTTAVTLYGGLSCSPAGNSRVWTYTGAPTEVHSPSAAYALSIAGVSPGAVTIEDVSFSSPPATAPGASSVAALVASSTVNLARVTLSAGSGANGAPGADGVATPNYTGPAPAGGAQIWSNTDNLIGAVSGGAGSVNRCTVFGVSTGGNGGLGCASGPGVPGGAGAPGTADPEPPVTTPGRDGLPMGATVMNDAGASVVVAANDPGADGTAAEGGVAGPPEVYGTLTATGWTPTAGGDGAPGNPGQGGAGAADPVYGQCNSVGQPSLGGGGGGAGGCGGAGGKGGSGGGASIALASIGSTVTLTDCELSAGAGGTGGSGGTGQDGQGGGAGGDVSGIAALHAAGGAGGNGAGGSGGAGGTGGLSVGILSKASTITSDPSTSASIRLGAPGAAGAPGPGGRHGLAASLTTGMDGNAGAPGGAGVAVNVLQLP